VKAALITAASPWQVVDVHACVDSTNLEALRDPRAWRVVVADFQSAGRGRLARQWRAPTGTSIAVSAVVPVPAGRAGDLGWLPLLSGMAMCAALAEVAQLAGRLKWPNDVMVQEGAGGLSDPGAPWLKISGVLCEMVPGGELVVIGTGANIAQERQELPVETATSVALCGARNVRREDVIVRYLLELADLHHSWAAGGSGLQALRTAYRRWPVVPRRGLMTRDGCSSWMAGRSAPMPPVTSCMYAARCPLRGTRHDHRHGRRCSA
jgi:BirA family biotin operon repressor/biotin-[acetyl-CoA-carboxylase] ligase